MRQGIDGLESPRHLLATMPMMYQTDTLAEQLCTSCDEVLAPIFATLDCLTAYLDPRTAPSDMLDWLAGWVGLATVGHHDATRKREVILAGIELLPWRGTIRSVREAVVAAFGKDVEVIESGSATGSTTPNSAPGGRRIPILVVRVTVNDEADLDKRSLDELVNAVKPAHVPHRVEVLVRKAASGS
jgi:phage tail-like protein